MSAAAGGGVLERLSDAALSRRLTAPEVDELYTHAKAVAELIAAAKEIRRWPLYVRGSDGQDAVAAEDRLDAALSNIEGGK